MIKATANAASTESPAPQTSRTSLGVAGRYQVAPGRLAPTFTLKTHTPIEPPGASGSRTGPARQPPRKELSSNSDAAAHNPAVKIRMMTPQAVSALVLCQTSDLG